MIILEGADGSGKTTLKNQLKRDLGLVDLSLTKVDPVGMRQGTALMSPRETLGCITDRSFFLSELVYSTLLRGYNTPQTIWGPLFNLVYKGHLVIICTGKGQDTRKEYDSDEAIWQKTQETKEIARRMYLEIAEELEAPTYDFAKDSYEDLKGFIKEYLESFHERV